MIMEKRRGVRIETWGHLKAAKIRKPSPGDWGEQPEKWKETQETVLSEEGISGRKVVSNCVNVADLRICCWIDIGVIGDFTIDRCIRSKPDRSEFNEKRGSRGREHR